MAVEASPESTSTSLICRIKAGDQIAWRQCFELYGPLVYGWIRRAGLAPEDAADVMQDVFAAVSKNIDKFRHDRETDTFRGWLRIISRSKICDYFNHRGKQPQAPGGTDALRRVQELTSPEDWDSGELAEDVARLYRRALDLVRPEFEAKTWDAFWFVAIEGYTALDAAAELHTTAGAVRQAKYRVLKRLREVLGDE